MPEETSSKDVGREPAGEPPANPPGQPPRDQIPAASPSGDDSNRNKSDGPDLRGITTGEYWLVGVGIVTLLVNIGIACIYLGQLRQMTKATIASEQSAYAACLGAQISRSALVEAQKNAAETYQATPASVYQALAATQAEAADLQMISTKPMIEINKSIGYVFGLKNEGKTAAINLRLEARAEFIPRNGKPEFTYPKLMSAGWTVTRFAPGDIVPLPSQGIGTGAYLADGSEHIASQKDILDYGWGKKDIVLYAKWTFWDVFGVRHETSFCEVHLMDKGTGIIESPWHLECSKYNRTDTNAAITPLPPLPVSTPTPDIDCKVPRTTE